MYKTFWPSIQISSKILQYFVKKFNIKKLIFIIFYANIDIWKNKRKGALKMQNVRTLEGVHTHTHTHTGNLNKIININKT